MVDMVASFQCCRPCFFEENPMDSYDLKISHTHIYIFSIFNYYYCYCYYYYIVIIYIYIFVLFGEKPSDFHCFSMGWFWRIADRFQFGRTSGNHKHTIRYNQQSIIIHHYISNTFTSICQASFTSIYFI